MFQGDFVHNIDPKNRLFIPAKFREELGDTFVVYPSPDGCLFIFTEEHWKDVTKQIMMNSEKTSDRLSQRVAMYGVSTVSPDKQGRITLTPFLVKKAGLQKEVMIFGVNTRIELWDMDRWNAMMEEALNAEGEAAESLYPTINY